jgi:arylsulfatase A
MKRREFVKAAGMIAAGTTAASDFAFGKNFLNGLLGSDKKPNIIFILADDLGIGNVSCYGADNYKTPRIDTLAREGVRFTHAYTAPLCGPSRALILTGRYAFRTGAVNQDMTGLMKPSVETMMPKILKPEGYVTAMIGKWGQLPLAPADFDFDYYMTFTGSGIYWNTQEKGKMYTVNGKKVPLRDKEYLPDVMHTHVVDFVTKHRDKPFYVYYSLSHVHAEILPTPDSAPDSKDYYADNIAYMDKLVGKLIDELERQKLRENTLIIFFGDNGTGAKYADQSTIGGRRLSGQKGSMLECGALVPMIVNWPGTTPAGKINEDMIDSTDFLPTFAELAGAKVPGNKVIDGRTILPQLRGEKGKSRDWIFIELGNQWYVREARWKLNRSGQLFDMSNAPFEEKLIPAKSKDPEAVAARKRLQAVLDKLNPGAGILDDGDGTGRHANKAANVTGKKKARQAKQDQKNEN